MEHLCYKCQTSIDETLPFCPHCGAPQIRVASPDEEASQLQPLSSDATPQVVPPASWTPGAPVYHPYAIQWELAWKGAFLSGLIAAVLTIVPVVSMGCCLWLLGAGALAVFLYQRRIPGAFVTPGMGMRIGAVSGVIAFVIVATWSTVTFTANSEAFRSATLDQMDKFFTAYPNPRAPEMMQQLTATLNSPQGLASYFVLSLVIMAIVLVVFSAAGGALGASMFARRRDLR